LGIVAVSWISDPKDTLSLSFIDKIRVMSVSPYEEAREDNSYLPFAAWIALKYYPLTRDIYSISSDAPGYLPSGFMHFIGGDRGQRIIMKSGIFPANRPIRLVTMNPKE
jgi:phosphate transport system substrate-binding protein